MRRVVFRASFTLHRPQQLLLVCVMTVQCSSCSMLMESRVMSSGSFATAGIVSINLWYASHTVFYHIPRKDHVMCGTERALFKALSWSKLIGNCMDRTFNSLSVFARPELRKNVRALPFKLHHALHLHTPPPRVVSLTEDGTTTHIVPTFHKDLPAPAKYRTPLFWGWSQLWETHDAHIVFV